MISLMIRFDLRLDQPDSFKELSIEATPTYDPYADDHEELPEPLDEEIEPTPELSDKFLKAHVQL